MDFISSFDWMWVSLEFLGAVIVIIGVWGEEWAERRKLPFDPNELVPESIIRKQQSGIFWKILLSGLAIELIGVSLTTIASHWQISDANNNAGNALKVAAAFNKEAEELRSNNLVLKLKMQPRVISAIQVTNFIFLTRYIPKFPISVGVGQIRNETCNYAWQIRNMLDQAGYCAPSSDSNLALRIHSDPTAFQYSVIMGDTNEWDDVDFVSDSTNDFALFSGLGFQRTNGFIRVAIAPMDTNGAYAAIINAFDQIGIPAEWHYKPDWVGTNHCMVFVMEKTR
jgi:hypothetical protein